MGGGTSADNIKIQYGQVANTVQLISTQAQRFNNLLEEGKGIAREISAQWSGDAYTQYSVQQTKWDNAAANLNRTLADINRALASASESMSHTDKRNAQLFQ